MLTMLLPGPGFVPPASGSAPLDAKVEAPPSLRRN